MRKFGKAVLIFFGSLVVLIVLANLMYEEPTSDELATIKAKKEWQANQKHLEAQKAIKAAEMVLTLQNEGVIIHFQAEEIVVNGLLWSRLNINDRELFMKTYVNGLPAMKEKGYAHCSIFDYKTGKRIVTYHSSEDRFF